MSAAEKPSDPVAAPTAAPADETKPEAAAETQPAAPAAAAPAPAATEAHPVDGAASSELKEAPAAEVEAAAAATDKAAEPKTAVAAEAQNAEKPAEAKPAETAAATAVTAEPATDKPAEEKPAAEKEKAKPAIQQLWEVAKAHAHPEIWGVTLADPETHVPSQVVLQKYLNANDGDFAKAKDQLVKTLDWRAKTKPLDLLKAEFSKDKFDGLGYVTSYGSVGDASADPESKEVFTWNIYGATKSIDETFGKLDEFLSWRTALMELALQELSIATATKPITADYDPYKIFQVHDYKSISFFRQSSNVKAASSETIKVFAQNYPELLKEKFFVNVPAIMGFMYAFMKLFVAPKTIKKFHPMSNGRNLALEFTTSTKVESLGEKLPGEYGGKGKELKAESKEPLLK